MSSMLFHASLLLDHVIFQLPKTLLTTSHECQKQWSAVPEDFWGSEDFSVTECIKLEDPSTAHDHQVGRAKTFTLWVTAQHTRFREICALDVGYRSQAYPTCFEVIMDPVLCDTRYFAGVVQHSELVHVQRCVASLLRGQSLSFTGQRAQKPRGN